MSKQRILILSEGFGTGHTQAARALNASLRHVAPSLQTRVIELGAFLNPNMSRLIFSAYKRVVSTTPHLVGRLYRSNESNTLHPITQLALHRIFYAQTQKIMKQLKPTAIICTHPFPCIVLSRLKREGLKVGLYSVITDYDAHGTWINSEVDLYLVSTPEVKRKLIARGVDSEKIMPTGIPIHPKFWDVQNHLETYRMFELTKMPTVVVMGGGWGLLGSDGLWDQLVAWRDQVQLVFCLGRNEKVKRRLLKRHGFDHPNVHMIGFTEHIDRLMDVCDLLITKPGGVTVTEAWAKGVPMLFYSPIPGQEEENCQFFTEQGYGEAIQNKNHLNQCIRDLVEQTPNYVDRKQKIRRSVKWADPHQTARAIATHLNKR